MTSCFSELKLATEEMRRAAFEINERRRAYEAAAISATSSRSRSAGVKKTSTSFLFPSQQSAKLTKTATVATTDVLEEKGMLHSIGKNLSAYIDPLTNQRIPLVLFYHILCRRPALKCF